MVSHIDTWPRQDGYVYAPERTCLAPVRGQGGRFCTLEPGHAGYHSSYTFSCDGCGRTLRGEPHGGPRDEDGAMLAAFCFLCARGARGWNPQM